jgi:hypothetical protein
MLYPSYNFKSKTAYSHTVYQAWMDGCLQSTKLVRLPHILDPLGKYRRTHPRSAFGVGVAFDEYSFV